MQPGFNPYEPPALDAEAPLAPDFRPSPLATRIDRFWAAFIDGVLTLLTLFPLQFVLDGWLEPLFSYGPDIRWTAMAFVVWTAIHGYWLARSAQTIGKRLLGLQIVNFDDGRPTSFAKIVFFRKLPMQLIQVVPVVGSFAFLIGLAFIFGRDRRCLHDVIARTKVVKLGGIRSLKL